MDANFWLARWQNNQIGFDQPEVNPLLIKHFNKLGLVAGQRVFVPLSGKTIDIAWLLQQGYQVVGVELSELAIEQLFQLLGLTPQISTVGVFTLYQAANLDMYVGDFFQLDTALLGRINAIYDRAAFIALPQAMRLDYSRHLSSISHTAPQLLISIEYDQSIVAGPPFSIEEQEIRAHYAASYIISLLERTDIADGLKGKYPAADVAWLLKQK